MIPQKTSVLRSRWMGLGVFGLSARDSLVLRTEAPALLVPVEAACARVTSGRADFLLDRSACLLLPRGTRAVLRASTPSRVALLYFYGPLLSRVVRTYQRLGLDRRRLESWLGRLELLPRTLWVHEIVHRYVFERYVLGQHDNTATRFLETEILKEIHFLFRDRDEGAERDTTLRRHTPGVERAVSHIEAHLFDVCSVSALARRSGASPSTLLRSFRRELGQTPAAYWRNRRLDEGLVLLRAGRHSVGSVADRLGYDNPTAFGFAFRRRFGRPPSAFLPRRPGRAAP